MLYDLCVIGGGYWGVATALLARTRGATVALVDVVTPEAASRVAAGYFAFSWFDGPWKERVRRGYETAGQYGIVVQKTGSVMLDRTGRQVRAIDDWYVIDPWSFLNAGDVGLRVPAYGQVLRPTAYTLETSTGFVEARAFVVAAGVRTDELLKCSSLAPMGIKPLWGASVIFDAPDCPGPIQQTQLNPYRAYALRTWGPGRRRIGETLETVPSRSSDYINKMLSVCEHWGWRGWNVREVVRGARPMLDEPTVARVAENVIAIGGGGRQGALISFWAAEEALKILGVA